MFFIQYFVYRFNNISLDGNAMCLMNMYRGQACVRPYAG
ncbi:hypothetical protein M104_1140 [Bacteroides fragilis str. 1007-1-F |uniref:Uncharacterized protein n=2 Tax=Bacteroides fragilis TaxID=817 RepID=A0AAN4SJM0_BACFG|nr:hypothetical protein M118_4268 [Bacteroides fragilis str. 3783N1-2]EXY48549.1 hypothetical protein M121_4725 [Bacteroides fragilis str. 3783N2-1]EXY53388.1 hypothetical protein M122_4632 [Bacteroides fragilis str. 3976T7]EXZ36235.1 hypothetical protein M147_4980 [Bacteroides fragilis str. 1007-1-F \